LEGCGWLVGRISNIQYPIPISNDQLLVRRNEYLALRLGMG
jgi:hypothetical protein